MLLPRVRLKEPGSRGEVSPAETSELCANDILGALGSAVAHLGCARDTCVDDNELDAGSYLDVILEFHT